VRRLAPIAAAAVLLAGCGERRTRPPDLTHAQAPQCCVHTVLRGQGISYRRPRNWAQLAAEGSLAGGVTSRAATVAVWRYPRTEPLPRDRAALEEVETLLLDRVRQRNPTFTLQKSEIVRIGGAPAIELVGSQTASGFGYDVRSAHVFRAGAEVVVDAYAPSGEFPRVDREVFRPLLASLEVTRP
jgi:hypothetical protein